HAAVVVLHLLRGVDLLGLVAAVLPDQPRQPAAGAVARGGEDVAVGVDRRRAVGGAIGRPVVTPQELAALGQANHPAAEELDVLLLAVALRGHDRGILGAVALRHDALPDRLAALLVQGDEGGGAAAGRAQDAVAVDQRRLAVAPAAGRALEVLDEVL